MNTIKNWLKHHLSTKHDKSQPKDFNHPLYQADWVILYATQSGRAEKLAQKTAGWLQKQSYKVFVCLPCRGIAEWHP